MATAETLFEARWIVPVEPAGAVLEGHALVVADGLITALLPSAEARARFPDATRIELNRHALIPGLVNAHTHAAMTLLRGYGDDMPLAAWLQERIWPAERQWVGPEFVRDGTALAVAEMLRGGVTCFADQYFFPDEAAAVVHAAGIRARLGLVVIDFPTAWADGPDEYLSKGLQVYDNWKQDPLISLMFAPHATYTVGDETLVRIRKLADEMDVPVHIHVHETAKEVADALAAHGERPLATLQRLGMVNPSLIAVHMTQLDEEEILLLAREGAKVVHCPQSNMKLASGICPVPALRRAGVDVALGTDGAASNNDLDMFDEMRTAALLAKSSTGDATALPAHEVLRMATLDGAVALGLGDTVGSLLPGKSADLVAVALDDLSVVPVHDPVSALVYAAGRRDVTDVWVAGRQLVADGVTTTLDAQELRSRAQAWQARLA